MQRSTTVEPGDGVDESPDVRLTVDVAGRRLVYAEQDLATIGFTTSDL